VRRVRADRPVDDLVRHGRQPDPGERVLLGGGGVLGAEWGLQGPQGAPDPTLGDDLWVQDCSAPVVLTDDVSRIVAFRQECQTTPDVPHPGFPSSDKGSPRRPQAPTNSRQIQQWAVDLDRRLPEHRRGRGARLLEVITQAGIGFRLARTWPGVTRARERQLKNQGGASRYCPICQAERKARGLPRRPTPAPAGRQQPARPGATSVPTRGVTPDQARTFLALNPAFARPVGVSLAVQWGRVRGREAVELAAPRVTVAWFDENRQLTQRRVAAIGRRATRARTQARAEEAAERAEQARTRALAARTRQRLTARQPQQQRSVANERRSRRRQEAEHER
jgi:hypothetical protein